MEANEIVWQGKIGSVPLRVAVPHAGLIIAQWDSPQGQRQKISSSMEEFERAVLFQLLLAAGEKDATVTEAVVAAVAQAQAERPRQAPANPERRRKKPKVRQHRRSRTPPRRR